MTPEDEAFDDLARRQGMWGGGFMAKRAMAADKFIAAEERKVGERYGYIPKLHPSEWMDEPTHCQCPACKDGVLHASDCAVHTGPAYSLGPCDCGVEKEQEEDWGALAEKQLASIKRDTQASFEDAMVRATHKVMAEFEAQPAQEPVECLDCGSNNVGIPATYDSLVDSVKSQPAQEPVGQVGAVGSDGFVGHIYDDRKVKTGDKLYTTPPKREWVGLTEEDFSAINQSCFTKLQAATSAESILKERNI